MDASEISFKRFETPAKRLKKASISIGWFFFFLGAVIGNFAAIIPFFMIEQNLSTAALGAILVSAIAGAIVGAPVVATCNNRFGSAIGTVMGVSILIIFAIVIGLPWGLSPLIIGLVIMGFGAAMVDISVNGQAILCEKLGGNSTMGLFHSLYALGGLSGVLFGGGLMEARLAIYQELGLFSAATLLPSLFFSYGIFSKEEEAGIEKLVCATPSSKNDENNSFENNSVDYGQTHVQGLIGNSAEDLTRLSDPTAEKQCQLDTRNNSAIEEAKDCAIAVINVNLPTTDCTLLNHDGMGSPTGGTKGMSATSTEMPAETQGTGLTLGSPTEPTPCVDYRALSILCLAGGLAYMGEGSIGDWSTVYLIVDLNASPLVGALGFAAFQLVVAIARYSSDALITRYQVSRLLLLRIAGVLSFLGLGLVTLAPSLATPIPAAILGFAVCGAGLSVVAPIVMYLAGTTVSGMKSSEAIASVASFAYAGVLVGPPMIGGLATATGNLRWALLVDGALLLLITVLAILSPLLTTTQCNEVVGCRGPIGGGEEA